MVNKYPDTYKDRKQNEEKRGKGYTILLKKFCNENENEHRESNANSLRSKLKIKAKDLKTLDYVQNGCLVWQLEIPQGESAKSLEQKKRSFQKL